MSHADRLEREYREYVAKNGAISKDEYLGKRLCGEIPASQRREGVSNEAPDSKREEEMV